jgi:glycosyltransferase involved in cell wall biosynthesis
MRLLLAVPYFAPAYAFGGSVTVGETVAVGMRDAGHEVVVVTTDVLDEHRRTTPDTPGPEGVEVHRFPNVSHKLAAAANGYLPRGLRGWLQANTKRFDAVLLHDFYSAVSVQTARAALRSGVPFALQPLGTVGAAAERGRPLVKRLFLTAFGRRTLATASALIHSTDHERQDFLDVGAPADRLVRLPLPLELPAALDLPRTAAPSVVSVGRLHPIKGIDRLIEAVAQVPDLRLDVAGPGERYQRKLEEVAAATRADVHFHGFVSAEEKQRLLTQAHCFALLSRAEGLPMATLEAMACGTPVVVSEGCHIPEVHGRAGLVTDGSPAATAAALTQLLGDPAEHARLAEGAKAFAHGFRHEVVLPQMEALLTGLR